MPQEFESLGISFLYPDNWTLDDSEAAAGRESVTLYSPGGAFWSVSIHPGSAPPDGLAKAAVQAMRDEYSQIETEWVQQSLGGQKMVGYNLSFYYLDLVNTATVRCFRTPTASYAIFCQGEDREFGKMERVFDAITTSLLDGLE